MSRTINGKLTGRAAQGYDDINDSTPQGNIIDEMIEAIKFYAEQKRSDMTWAVSKKGTACLFCKHAFSLHKKQASVKDALMAYLSIGDSDDPIDDAEFEIGKVRQIDPRTPEQIEADLFAKEFDFDRITEIQF